MATEYESELEKYNVGNPLMRLVLQKYAKDICSTLKNLPHESILDAGCGTGFLMKEIHDSVQSKITGVDILPKSIAHAKKLCPKCSFHRASLYHLPFKANSFDAVLCSEVLEHLDDPKKALAGLKRVAKDYCIVCVPYEPFFSIANILRLKYLRNWGNYPGHIHKWGRKGFRKLLEGHFSKVKISASSFWLIGVCKK
ncbi:MAG: class I SAM-dependent methyltransferase [Nanoarchaeota archaeon]|nr:class I SAM-dependent methyltransferase [Nanoarchaeota archaeon]